MLNICKKYDLKIFDVKYIPTAGGSLRYYITKNKNFDESKNISKYLDIENKIDFKSEETYQQFFENNCFLWCNFQKHNYL